MKKYYLVFSSFSPLHPVCSPQAASTICTSPKWQSICYPTHNYVTLYRIISMRIWFVPFYPDSGYVNGNTYGEDSHWDPFIYAFSDYLKQTYPSPKYKTPNSLPFYLAALHIAFQMK